MSDFPKVFVQLISDELEKRISKNSKYSLRSFGRDLAVEPSLLSKIMRGMHNLTPAMVRRLSEGMKLSPEEVDQQVANLLSYKESKELEIRSKVESFVSLDEDRLAYISRWYHLGILALAETAEFVFEADWIASRLDLDQEDVQDAMDRLVRLGSITVIDGKAQLQNSQYTTMGIPNSTQVLKDLQADILGKAQDALYTVDIKERSQSSLTFAVDKKLVPKIQEEINRFRRQINKIAASESDAMDSVYIMSLSLFPITKDDEI